MCPAVAAQCCWEWRKRRWRCRTENCPQQTFTEQVGQVPAGMRTTTRLREGLARAVEDGRNQSEVATAHGVSWPTAQRALVAYAARQLAEPELTTVLGMDETRFGRPRWLPSGVHDDGRIRWRRSDPWETGFVDITGDQALMGQVDGRTSAAGVGANASASSRADTTRLNRGYAVRTPGSRLAAWSGNGSGWPSVESPCGEATERSVAGAKPAASLDIEGEPSRQVIHTLTADNQALALATCLMA